MTAVESLHRIVDGELAQPVSAGAHAIVARIREIYGSAICGVLFYGSCLRRSSDEGVLDLYVLVDRYRDAYASRALVLLNRVLPPNVFYLEVPDDGRLTRAKYAVLTLDDLERFTAERCFEPYFWARFAQPCALVYSRDERARGRLAAALSNAIVTFVRRAVPLLPPRFDSAALWTTAWRETYRAEFRAERPGVVETLWASAGERYQRVTELALRCCPYPLALSGDGAGGLYEVQLSGDERRHARRLWRLRRLYGKSVFLLRILRNALIFEGGVDYVLWKIQRHSGIEVDSTWRQRRHPLLALGAQAWRLYRAGGFH